MEEPIISVDIRTALQQLSVVVSLADENIKLRQMVSEYQRIINEMKEDKDDDE